MSKKNKYTDLCEQMKNKVQEAGGTRYSDADRTLLTQTLLNTPDHEMEIYMKDDDGTSDPVTTKPVEEFRDSLKPMLKSFGVDEAEAEKIRDYEFTKNQAKALNAVSDTAMKGYLDTGRKMIYPIISKDEAQMEIAKVFKPEKSTDTRKPVETSPGHFESVPTGERRTTSPHYEMTASNKVPGWLVSKTKID